jgi:xylitol oxidase
MTKRFFLQFISAMMATPYIAPLLAWAAGEKLKNWAGNVEYGTDRLYSADTVEQVQAFVKKQPTLPIFSFRCGRWTK